MSIFMRISFIVGTIFTIGGSFLPWRQEGDYISYYYPGIRIYPSIHDYGGFMIVLLSIAIIVLAFRPPDFIGEPSIWSIVAGMGLVIASAFHIIKLMVIRADMAGVFGAPDIEIGLIMVFIGSMVLLSIAVVQHWKPRR
jgi:hypothetical protein